MGKNSRAFVEILQLNVALPRFKEKLAKERSPKKEGEKVDNSVALVPIPEPPEMREIKKRIEFLKLGAQRRLMALASWSDVQMYEKRKLIEW